MTEATPPAQPSRPEARSEIEGARDESSGDGPRHAESLATASAPSGEWTPMLRHYLEVKSQHPNAILLYRMGDFFETFFRDAEIAAPIFEVQLTARQRGTPNEAAMCGVPHHAVDGYIAKLLRAGLKVAICDQVEDPAKAKGLVRREVTRVVTPGTVTDLALLDSRVSNYLACLVWRDGEGAAAFLEVTTGAFFVRRYEDSAEAVEDVARYRPSEVLHPESGMDAALERALEREVVCRTTFSWSDLEPAALAGDRLCRALGAGTVRAFGLAPDELAVRAAARVLAYASEVMHVDLDHLSEIEVRIAGDTLVLDETSQRNLEVFRNQRDHGRGGTLIDAVDRTVTAAGARMLRDWLARPLRDLHGIERRLEAVGELLDQSAARSRLRKQLAHLADIERLTARAVIGNLSPAEAAALRDTLAAVPGLLSDLGSAGASLLQEIAAADPVADSHCLLESHLVEHPPPTLKDGGVIATGVDSELDRLRSLAQGAKEHLLRVEEQERKATGIPSLKVRFNRVFGYYLEVTRANRHLVPERYVRKQTLANAERYFTEELKRLEDEILGAEGRQIELEHQLFEGMRQELARHAGRLRGLAAALARLDALCGFSEVAGRHDYRRPRIEAGGALRLRDSRHPVVEQVRSDSFVPNDADLDDEARVVLLTGPNMGGKSTYLRQVALIALLAHAGSYVPARSAEIPLLDRIFTRVGASDDLARGESTFMVEMIETANILRYATPSSLVVLDEVGRGTSTYDGLSLAWAIVEHLHEVCGSLTMFATHYHELTELATTLGRVRNLTMAVREWRDQVVFLHRVAPGAADRSYGIHVAKLAGLPTPVVARAEELLRNLEADGPDPLGRPRWARGENAPAPPSGQLALFARPEDLMADLIRDLDLGRLTPLAALNLLQTLKKRLG
ncbi:MAG TPA: DNA mismatch repair protein MutS [Thermoanaerobaculia bacterium]|nr:DNA mismatch repair protein MutS [Thermoanaerobaculia bacterium]